MGPGEISNPHDRFFKEVFSREEVAWTLFSPTSRSISCDDVLRDDLGKRLTGIIDLLRKLSGAGSITEFPETVVRYLCLGTDKITEQNMGKAIRTAFPETGGGLMATLAEKWFQQGERKGFLRGERRGLLRGIELA